MDKKSFMLGFQLGELIAGQRGRKGRQIVGYLYNGVQYPALPEWDTETYPYALIADYGPLGEELYVSGSPVIYYGGYQISAPFLKFRAGEDTWVFHSEKTEDYETDFTVWSNHNVYYNGDSAENLYCKGSLPVPVYA